ncbi:MAG: type VI secretion system baseplate subunit TssE, partial [Planctomycetales bacterium]
TERLQPSLLDRLRDDHPSRQRESRDSRVLSQNELRECVLRDLAWLLNTGNMAQYYDLSEYPHAENTVINYGMPDLAGKIIDQNKSDIELLERQLRQAILDFEPRLLRNSVRVRAVQSGTMNMHHLSFEIEGKLWAQPLPLQLFLKTEFDLETGAATVVENRD